jgi:flagellar basal body P-ring protein FlgI
MHFRAFARRPVRAFVSLSLALSVVACSAPAKPIKKPVIVRDVPNVLRGTIGSEVTFRGIEPVLVSGLGFVVGLKGTGGKPLPDTVAATMEREMGLKRIGKGTDAPGTGIDAVSPRELLRDPNTAVVVVQAAIPPGAPAGARFDVYVEAMNADSLEGGLLWSTELRIGEPTTFGQMQTRGLADSYGPIFVNPFTEPGKEREGPTAKRGRVLNGGSMSNPLKIEMVLDNDSHTRGKAIVSAINTRLPMGPGDPGPTAAGKMGGQADGPSIVLRVPGRFRDNASDFLNLVQHLPIDQSFPEERTKAYVEEMKRDPEMADEIAWCLEAVGEKALPFTRELYESPDRRIRIAALRAGSRLGDARAATHLKDLAERGIGPDRAEAITLLAKIEGGPTVDQTLTKLLAEKELVVRVAAYEALAKRAERIAIARAMRYRASNPDSELGSHSPQHIEAMATAYLPPGTLQGIERTMLGGKFFVDVVPVGDPLIYVTQQGPPRIVLFGADLRIARPVVASAWSDRLMITADEASPGSDVPEARVYFKRDETSRAITQSLPDDDLRSLIALCAKANSADDPRPGLGMTYSEVVGALNALCAAGGANAAFATETDRLKAKLLGAGEARLARERPETPTDPEDVVMIRQPKSITPMPTEPAKDSGPKIVPIAPKKTK